MWYEDVDIWWLWTSLMPSPQTNFKLLPPSPTLLKAFRRSIRLFARSLAFQVPCLCQKAKLRRNHNLKPTIHGEDTRSDILSSELLPAPFTSPLKANSSQRISQKTKKTWQQLLQISAQKTKKKPDKMHAKNGKNSEIYILEMWWSNYGEKWKHLSSLLSAVGVL